MQKLGKLLLGISFAVVTLSSCASLKPFPDVDYCSGIDAEEDYAYCISYYEESNREYQVPSAEVFRRGYIMVSPKHYGEIRKYILYLQKQAEERCK